MDPSQKNRQSAQEKFGIEKGYNDIDELFANEQIDAVSICSPNKYHAEHAIQALRNGSHVLCEKPLCMDIKQANALQKEAQKAGTIFMTAFTHRLYKGNQKAKQWMSKIGDPYIIRMRFAHQGPLSGWAMSDWFYNPNEAGGGAMFDMGIHAIDLASFYMGPIKKVNAMVATLEKEISLDDTAIMQFEFEDGSLGTVEVGWTSKQGFFGVEIYGSEAAIVVDFMNHVEFLQGQTSPSGKRTVKKRIIEKPDKGGWDLEWIIRQQSAPVNSRRWV